MDSSASRCSSQVGAGPDAPVLGEPFGQLGGGLVGIEVFEPELAVVREQLAGLQLEQRGGEDEELAGGLERRRRAFVTGRARPALDERQHDLGHLHVCERQLLLEHERQQQVERALERVEIELELANRKRAHRRRL